VLIFNAHFQAFSHLEQCAPGKAPERRKKRSIDLAASDETVTLETPLYTAEFLTRKCRGDTFYEGHHVQCDKLRMIKERDLPIIPVE
jgi:hypothetical protein